MLASVEQSPRRNDFAPGVAQNRKLDVHFAAQRLRARAVIDGNPDDLRAGLAKFFVIRRIFRQLAEAERSPMPAVEKHHAWRARAQLREATHRARRVGKRELWCGIADRRRFARFHAHEDSGAPELPKAARASSVELHEIDDAVVVPLADYESTLKRPDGQVSTVERKTGKAAWVARGAREFEAGAKGVDALLIEIKHAP